MVKRGKPHGIRSYITEWPLDAYGNRYYIGAKVISPRFGVGTVIGLANGFDRRTCAVCGFHTPVPVGLDEDTARWRTWLIPVEEGVVVGKSTSTDEGEKDG